MTLNNTEEVLVQREGRAGLIVLNRPAALNALTHAMVLRITEALDLWERDNRVDTAVITGAGDRAFCTGGDIVAIHHAATGWAARWPPTSSRPATG
ncbi:enoyl-CoA hydratase/isomerase family protein [Streptomyces sp. CBMA156]|uniref:enoyl-CoA hydratase/isomerase family protein n=1 Tax=Streptomyces sp. CBMA156 TaxID=1930280 RepID=UPI001661CBC5|nr:enoyl-CoA hydratase/isomerase family protein [Streptomyces sp. CBMA156]MBD0670193.1 hypothetical protein [Streptomyces sp. CBMA156]